MNSSENSALVALSELKDLEADRVAKEEAERLAKIEAERAAREAQERAAREAVEREARERAEREAKERAEREAREREERLRLQEAEAAARAEQEARLREEQMRIDAQMRMAERQSRPKWPIAVIAVLLVGVFAVGYFAWESRRQAEEQALLDAQEKERQRKKIEEQNTQLAAIAEEIRNLKSEQERLEADRSALDDKLEAAHNEAERARLLAEKEQLDEKIAKNVDRQATASRRRRRDKSADRAGSPTPAASEAKPKPKAKPVATGRKDKVSLSGESEDPLSGL